MMKGKDIQFIRCVTSGLLCNDSKNVYLVAHSYNYMYICKTLLHIKCIRFKCRADIYNSVM